MSLTLSHFVIFRSMRKNICQSVVRQHLRTGVWGAKLSILWTGKWRRAQAHRFLTEHNVGDIKPSHVFSHIFYYQNNSLKVKLLPKWPLDTIKLQCTAIIEIHSVLSYNNNWILESENFLYIKTLETEIQDFPSHRTQLSSKRALVSTSNAGAMEKGNSCHK